MVARKSQGHIVQRWDDWHHGRKEEWSKGLQPTGLRMCLQLKMRWCGSAAEEVVGGRMSVLRQTVSAKAVLVTAKRAWPSNLVYTMSAL